MSETRFKPHSAKQEQIIFSDSDLTIAATGTQYGKSMSGAIWLKRKIHQFNAPGSNFLLTAPNYKIMQQSMLPYFLRYMRGAGKYLKADACFEMPNERMVYLRTETDPDSIVGIPNLKAGWGDEAGKWSLYFWENLQARAASLGAALLLTTSPYSRNWIYKDLIKPKLAGAHKDVTLIQAASWENPYHSLHDPDKRRKMRETMDERRFDMLFGGEWGQMMGLVYDCWDDDVNLVEPLQLPVGTTYIGGIDWGYYPDPFALKVRAITPDGRHYGIAEFVKTKLTITDIVNVCKLKQKTFGIKRFWADPSQPGYIEEMNRGGMSCQGADNDIRRGIDLHYELIKTRRYKEFKGTCPHTADERENYHYPDIPDLKEDQASKELLPVDKGNHCMDVDRYLTLMEYRNSQRVTPKTPEDTRKPKNPIERLEMLKRKPQRNSQTEDWTKN